MQITRHYLTIDGAFGTNRRVHFRRCGSGPPLLMVHQSPRSSAEYESLMKQWGEYFTCIAPDTPGFGQSDPLDHPKPEIADYADAVGEFVRAMNIAPCAAYGFHSGGIICVTVIKRQPELFTALAVGGYAVWTEAEMDLFGTSYLPAFQPSKYGEHLTWLWNRILEQSWFFPWFDTSDKARLSVAHADPERVQAIVMEMLDSREYYQAGYGAVLRAPRDIPAVNSNVPPCLIVAFDGDPLQEHIDRLGEMPANWSARKVRTPADLETDCLEFLKNYAGETPDQYPQDKDTGWLEVNGGLVHWRGTKGAKRLVLHNPGAELSEPAADEIAIDAPGHGLSDENPDIVGTIAQAAAALGAEVIVWPEPPVGDPALLYPDLTPDRFGTHLAKAWGIARAQAIFEPWYAADAGHAAPVDPAALKPAAIAQRARALLRAGTSARRYHDALANRI